MEKLIQPEPGMMIWTIITFGLLLIVLRVFAWKPILAILDEREKTIKDSLESAEMAREEGQRHLADSREALKQARKEMTLDLRRATSGLVIESCSQGTLTMQGDTFLPSIPSLCRQPTKKRSAWFFSRRLRQGCLLSAPMYPVPEVYLQIPHVILRRMMRINYGTRCGV